MSKFLAELFEVGSHHQEIQKFKLLESVDSMLGGLYAKLGADGVPQIDTGLVAKRLAGLVVLGKKDFRSAFPDLQDNVVILRLLNDVDEQDQQKMFSDEDEHKYNQFTANEKLEKLGSHATKVEQEFKELLDKFVANPKDGATLNNLKNRIGKMRTFFAQVRNNLRTQVKQSLKL